MDAPRISLLLPTRGRPQLAKRFFRSVVETAAEPDLVEIILYIDEDDESSHGLECQALKMHRIIGPPTSMGSCNHACFHAAAGDILMLANDDMVIRTPAWDRRLREIDARYPDKIYLAYGNDMVNGKGLCTFPVLSRRVCRLLVEPYPQAYQGAWIDVHLLDIFQRLRHAGYDRICYLPEVIFEHLHYQVGKAPVDETYKRRGRFTDDGTFLALIGLRKKMADRLIGVLNGIEPRQADDCRTLLLRTPPENLLQVFRLLTRELLFDRSLPFRWRSYLWFWLTGRTMKAGGMLPRFPLQRDRRRSHL